jgi:hypothetical protein
MNKKPFYFAELWIASPVVPEHMNPGYGRTTAAWRVQESSVAMIEHQPMHAMRR